MSVKNALEIQADLTSRSDALRASHDLQVDTLQTGVHLLQKHCGKCES